MNRELFKELITESFNNLLGVSIFFIGTFLIGVLFQAIGFLFTLI